jgi:RNA polymerase sigma-70 factor (ECF subfamily)
MSRWGICATAAVQSSSARPSRLELFVADTIRGDPHRRAGIGACGSGPVTLRIAAGLKKGWRRFINATEPLRPEEFEFVVGELEVALGRFLAQMIPERALAEDVLQETFCVAWRERDRMPRDGTHRRGWLYGVARNRALHALRKQRRGSRALDALAAEPPPGDLAVSEAFAMRDLVARTLSPQDRSLFLLRYVHGFSAPELAGMTGLRPATVRKRLERCANTLRDAMTDSTLAENGQPDGHASIV